MNLNLIFMSRKRRTVGDVAREVLLKSGRDSIGYVDFGLLGEVFSKAKEEGLVREAGSKGGQSRPHPMNRHRTVLNCLERDTRFEKHLMRCTDGRRETLVRIFYLKT